MAVETVSGRHPLQINSGRYIKVICICIHAYMHTCIHACTHTHIHKCTHTCTHAHTRTYIVVCIHPHSSMYQSTCQLNVFLCNRISRQDTSKMPLGDVCVHQARLHQLAVPQVAATFSPPTVCRLAAAGSLQYGNEGGGGGGGGGTSFSGMLEEGGTWHIVKVVGGLIYESGDGGSKFWVMKNGARGIVPGVVYVHMYLSIKCMCMYMRLCIYVCMHVCMYVCMCMASCQTWGWSCWVLDSDTHLCLQDIQQLFLLAESLLQNSRFLQI
jgi:hypothetical protein